MAPSPQIAIPAEALAMTQQRRDAYRTLVHLVVDLPSLVDAARTEALARGEPEAKLQVHAAHLRQIMGAGRSVASTTLVADRTMSEVELAPFRRCFDEVLVVDRMARDFVETDRRVGDAVSRVIEGATEGSTIVVATAENAESNLGAGLSTSLVVAIARHLRVELMSFARASKGPLGALHRELGILGLLDPHFDAVTYVEGGRAAVGPNLRKPPGVVLTPWHEAALRDADDILNRRPGSPIPWRRLRWAPDLDIEELTDLLGWIHEIGDDGDLNAALDRYGLRVSRRNRLVRNFEALMHAVEPPDGVAPEGR